MAPSVLHKIKLVLTDHQPSMKVSSITGQAKGYGQVATTAKLNTITHDNTGCLQHTTDELKSQPGISFSEHKAMRTFIGKKDTLLKHEMQLYNVDSLNQEEQFKLLEETRQAKSLVLTMMFHNGSSQLSASKVSVLSSHN